MTPTISELANLSAAICLGVFDEHYSPVQRLTLITAIDMYSLVLAGSREQPIIASAANFWGYFRSMDYPAAYAEALSIQRV